jgi:CubicO group peptidase (beta-lactamase class C family)
MHDSFFDTDVARRPTMAVRYDDAGDPLPFYLTATPGSGEMYSSAHDLARFAMFHLKDTVAGQAKILTAAQLDELHRPVTEVAAPAHAYAMGWQVLRRPSEPDVLYHGGGQPGVKTEFVLVPSLDIACVVLSNRRSPTFLAGVRDRMLQTVAPRWHGIPEPATSPLQPLAPLADYVGEWRGELIAQGRPVAVSLTIERDRRGSLAIDHGPAAPITEFGLIDGSLSGETKGEIGSPDTRRKHLTALSLSLKLRNNVIDGEIIAFALTDKHMTILPHWVELHLQPAR